MANPFTGLTVVQDFCLQAYNTFGFPVYTRYYLMAYHEAEAIEALGRAHRAGIDVLVLGGGSNLLLVKDWPGLVLHMQTKGKRILQETEQEILLQVSAGEHWHELVMWTVSQGWWGLENLALIPGTVGAAPIQNIGAYGVELKDVLHHVRLWKQDEGMVVWTVEDCMMGYRDSIFKRMPAGSFLVLDVCLRLRLQPKPVLHYPALHDYLARRQRMQPTVGEVAEAVMDIRRAKLPDPKVIGNAGSFFKNPVVGRDHFEELQEQYPDIPFFGVDAGHMKIPAAWLIEQCGWKGKRIGNVGVHERQALVLVHYGGGTGLELWQLAERIQQDVEKRFGIYLEPEVKIIA